MRTTNRMITAFAALLFSLAAYALEVQDAKSAGWLGEQRDGYLGLVSDKAPADARELLARINAERRSHYQAIAAKNQLELRAVEMLAAEKAQQKTPPGQYIQAADGSWVRK